MVSFVDVVMTRDANPGHHEECMCINFGWHVMTKGCNFPLHRYPASARLNKLPPWIPFRHHNVMTSTEIHLREDSHMLLC